MLRVALIALLAWGVALPARAAEGQDNCTGTITSLPATISTPGTWCLADHVYTAITSGAAITVAADDVIVDCNDFKLGGLPGYVNTNTVGVLAVDRLNTVVRHCVIRGFIEGVRLGGSSAGGLIADNRFDQNTVAGIVIAGSSHVVIGNRIFRTGGRPASVRTDGIRSTADYSRLLDNAVRKVTVTGEGGSVRGISTLGDASEIAWNSISGLVANAPGDAVGIDAGASANGTLHRNQLLAPIAMPVTGTAILSGAQNQCGHNSYAGWTSGIVGCSDAGSNFGN